MFQFSSAQISPSQTDERLVVVLPQGIKTQEALLESLYELLQLPGYFGFNWNALNDCLHDFHWLNRTEIVIVHHDVPQLPERELRIYLEILSNAAVAWKPGDAHRLMVIFPQEASSRVMAYLGSSLGPRQLLMRERKGMNLSDVVAKHVLGLVAVEALPQVGVELMVAGHDTPSLRQLAGADGYDFEEIRRLFLRTLDELGEPVPSPQEAGLHLAGMFAREVLDGTLTPYEGARRIWDDVYVQFPELEQLRIFVGLASEYEDVEKYREAYSRDIVDECEKLVEALRQG